MSCEFVLLAFKILFTISSIYVKLLNDEVPYIVNVALVPKVGHAALIKKKKKIWWWVKSLLCEHRVCVQSCFPVETT